MKVFKEIAQHGVFIDVNNMGVLLSGESGIGKSELALGLISRGHRLIADDSVIFENDDQRIIGRCPPLLQDFLEVRGLGILNIKAMFNETAIQKKKQLKLIINIIQVSKKSIHLIDRLYGMHGKKDILGIEIPEVSIPVAPGRNLSILVEAAVKNHLLKMNGYNSSEDFTQRHQYYMQRENNE